VNNKALVTRKWAMIWLGLLAVIWLAGACSAESAPGADEVEEAQAVGSQGATEGVSSPVTAIRYSPDTQTLLTGHENGAIQLWDASGAPQLTLNGHQGAVVDVAASPDGSLVASVGTDKQTLLQSNDGSTVNELEESLARANTVDFSPDGEQLAVGFWEKLELWPVNDLNAGPTQIEDLEPSVSLAYFTPDGESLMVAMSNTGLAQSALLRVNPDDSSVVQTLHPSSPAFVLIASPDSEQMATASKEEVQLWRPDSDTSIRSLPIADVKAMAFGDEGETLLTVQPDEAGLVITVWDLSTGEALRTINQTVNQAVGGDAVAAFSPDGGALAIGLADGRVEIVDLAE